MISRLGLTGIDAMEAEVRDRLAAKSVEIADLRAKLAVVVEECAKIAEGHVGMYRDEPKAAGYDEASCDIAKVIRGTYGHE